MSATYISSISFEVGIWNSYYQKLFEKLTYKVSDTVKTCAVSEYIGQVTWFLQFSGISKRGVWELPSSKRDVRNIITIYKEWFLFGFCLD